MFCMVLDSPDVGGCDVGEAISLGELPVPSPALLRRSRYDCSYLDHCTERW